jgi:hypothetical protein
MGVVHFRGEVYSSPEELAHHLVADKIDRIKRNEAAVQRGKEKLKETRQRQSNSSGTGDGNGRANQEASTLRPGSGFAAE